MSLEKQIESLNIELKELHGIVVDTQLAFINFQEEVNSRFNAAQEQVALINDEEKSASLIFSGVITASR
ncbi:hypothetical protein [Atlantibacter sp.]|uniref:hypothetical protein n=1 Tax=Atlantibacter sp. TaxID=1903473 RepID=UPI0028A5D3FC|nr:hypothetical protein [Atlantibacter sp.]